MAGAPADAEIRALPGYAYTDDNPITQTDPTGQMREPVGGGGTYNGDCKSDNSCSSGANSGGKSGKGSKGTAGLGSGSAYIGCLSVSGDINICNNTPMAMDNTTPVTLALDWLLGIGSRSQTFDADSRMAQELASDGNIQALYRLIQQEIDSGKDQAGLRGAANYKDPGNSFQAVKDLAGVFTGGRIGSNPVDGFLGSYELNYTLTPVDDGKAKLSIIVTNTSNYASFSHADRFLPSFLSSPINNGPDLLSRDVIEKVWDKRGPMATIDQTFSWSKAFYADSCYGAALSCD